MEMVLSCTVLRIDLSFVSKNLWFSPFSWPQTLRPEESQRLKVDGVDSTLEEEEVHPDHLIDRHADIDGEYGKTESDVRIRTEKTRPTPYSRVRLLRP